MQNKIILTAITAAALVFFLSSCTFALQNETEIISVKDDENPVASSGETSKTAAEAIANKSKKEGLQKIGFEPAGVLDLPSESMATDIWALPGGRIAYLLSTHGGLEVIDAQDENHPGIIDSVKVDGFANTLFISGNYLYVASGNSNFHVFDITDPQNPLFINKAETVSAATDIFISGNYAFVSTADKGIQIFDISDKNQISSVCSLPLEGISYSLYKSGRYVYACAYSGGIYIIDADDISNPVIKSVIKEITHPADIYVEDDFALVANNYPPALAEEKGLKNPAGLYLIDLHDTKNPVIISKVDTQISKFCVLDNIAFIASLEEGLKAVSIDEMKIKDKQASILASAQIDGSAYSVFATDGHCFVSTNIFTPVVSEKETESISTGALQLLKLKPE